MSKSYGASFCIIYSGSTSRFLMEHRGKDVGNPLSYGFFGGGIEKNETPAQAMRRELKEESGLEVKSFDYGLKLSAKVPVYIFVKMLESEFEPVLSWESAGYRWVKDLDDVKPLHKKLLKHYGKLRRLMEATRKAYLEETENVR